MYIIEATPAVMGLEQRDGMIRQKIKLLILMKLFDRKRQFVSTYPIFLV